MSNPTIAIVGRPNVGKSTIFNRIAGERISIVEDTPGVTRDRIYATGEWLGREFSVIDTGGIDLSDEPFMDQIKHQAEIAIDEADVIVFITSAREGVTDADELVARLLYKSNKPVILAVNKVDNPEMRTDIYEFYGLGLGDPYPISGSHGLGIGDVLDEAVKHFTNEAEEEDDSIIKFSLIGRPNVGKSTLVNRLLGEERVVAFDEPGTTRDSIYIPYERDGRQYTLIDTAGVRRKGKVDEMIEKFSIVKTLQAIKDAHVIVVVLDAREGVVEQDLHLIGYALEAGRAMVVAINKWDNMTEYDRKQCKLDVDRRFDFIPWAKVHLISALHGTGVGELYPSIHRAYDSSHLKVSPAKLTQILNDATDAHQPPMISGKRIKMRYAHMGGQNPPTIVIHGNKVDKTPADYRRYLENVFRKVYKLEGTPVRIDFKTSENPFEGRKSQIDERVAARKRRYIQKFKKAEKKFKR